MSKKEEDTSNMKDKEELEKNDIPGFKISETKKELIEAKKEFYGESKEKMIEEQNQKCIENVIKKWLNLQKTIKEEITLEDVIIKQQANDTDNLKDFFKKYYGIKLNIRKNWEEINEIKKDNKNKNILSYFIEDEVEKNLRDACEPIKNLLFILRNNYDYLTRLISLIKIEDFEQKNLEKVNSFIELLINQFYENILISNPEQQEFLILIYKLFEEEVIPMGGACLDEFLSNNSFIGLLLSSYTKRQEIIGYISMILNPIILSIDNDNRDCLDLSIASIKRNLEKQNIRRPSISSNYINRNQDMNFYSKDIKGFLFDKIPKTKIKFKNNFELEAEKEKEDENKFVSKDDDYMNILENNSNYFSYKRGTVIQRKSLDISCKDEESEINKEYKIELNRDRLVEKIKQENDPHLKRFFMNQLEQLSNYPNKFTNEGIIKTFENESDKKQLIMKYKENFLYIRANIEKLLQSIVDKIITLPYPLRCICKIIHLFISKKFPSLSKFEVNSFIGKFIFDKCIFPVLSLENKNFIDSRVYSQKTKNCLDVIISVLSKANSASLFDTYSDPEKTIFNQFLIEIIPTLNKFYEKIIEVQLPKVLEDLIIKTNKRIEQTYNKKIFNFRHKKIRKVEEKNQTPKGPDKTLMPPPLFQYFHENSDEILHFQSICFSVEDINFLIEIIQRKIDLFSDLPKYNFFTKTVNRISNEKERLSNLIKEDNSSNKKSFFVIFREEINTQLEKLIKKKKKEQKTFEANEQDSEVKFCIKTILKGMNLLNNKDFAYLNFAQTSDKFFSALKYTLEELGEYSELSNNIPLKWYSQYIFMYKKELRKEYQKNDFEKLYEEIYTEESNILNELKSLSNIVITRDGMNIRCAEKIIDKANYELKHIEEEKKYVKVEKFINTKKVEVCILPSDEVPNRVNTEENEELPFEIMDIKNCIHNNISNEKIINHATYIIDFINKFSDVPISEKNYKLRLKTFITENIRNGEKTNLVYPIIGKYMDFVKKQIKDPENKYLFEDIKEADTMEYMQKIENYIIREIYKYVYPTMKTDEDQKFFNLTRSLEFLTPEHLEIKKLYVNQLKFAEKYMQRMTESKSVFDKLDCIQNAYVAMNNTVKFISGKNEDAGQDELTPLFQYVLIKSKPERLISDINYIKSFLSEADQIGPKGFYVSQMESASSFISDLDHKQLNMSKEEFEEKKLESLRRNQNKTSDNIKDNNKSKGNLNKKT